MTLILFFSSFLYCTIIYVDNGKYFPALFPVLNHDSHHVFIATKNQSVLQLIRYQSFNYTNVYKRASIHRSYTTEEGTVRVPKRVWGSIHSLICDISPDFNTDSPKLQRGEHLDTQHLFVVLELLQWGFSLLLYCLTITRSLYSYKTGAGISARGTPLSALIQHTNG